VNRTLNEPFSVYPYLIALETAGSETPNHSAVFLIEEKFATNISLLSNTETNLAFTDCFPMMFITHPPTRLFALIRSLVSEECFPFYWSSS
jgi:hypothetical protein